MRLGILISCLLVGMHSWALEGQGDTSADLIGRSTPVGLSLEGTAGYGVPLWGDSKDGNPFYGYLRPFANVALSSVAASKFALEFYPVSFVGFTVGRSYRYRTLDFSGINCEASACKGWLNSTYVRARVIGKFQNFFGSLVFEKYDFDHRDDLQGPIIEEINAVNLAPRHDEGCGSSVVVGYSLDDEWSAGLRADSFKTRKWENTSEMQVVFVRSIRREWTYIVGLGRFASSQFGVAPEVVAAVNWTGLKKIGP